MASRLALSAVLVGAVIRSRVAAEAANQLSETPPAATDTSATEMTADTTAETTPAPAPTTQRITIRVVGGMPRGGIARPEVKKGANVLLVVRSDTADEIHLHGYDISRDLSAGDTARIRFVARIPGRFELELEKTGVVLAELTVQQR